MGLGSHKKHLFRMLGLNNFSVRERCFLCITLVSTRMAGGFLFQSLRSFNGLTPQNINKWIYMTGKELRARLETLCLYAISRHVEKTGLYTTAQNREGNQTVSQRFDRQGMGNTSASFAGICLARHTPLREVINALLYVVRSGCSWRMLPKEFGPWQTIYWWFRRLMRRFLFSTILNICIMFDRFCYQKKELPSLGILDSQSVKAPRPRNAA